MVTKELKEQVIERITRSQGHFNMPMYLMLEPYIELAYKKGYIEGFKSANTPWEKGLTAEEVLADDPKSERSGAEAYNPDDYYTLVVG